jgi:hypothetical protein
MANSTKLALPFLDAAQAQKHVTHNDALMALDALVMLSVKGLFTNTPPGSPADGDRYITGGSPTGAWAGQAGKVAARQDGTWRFYSPQVGWISFVESDGVYVLDQTFTWQKILSGSALQNLSLLGVNATADATNKLAVASEALLFTHAGADMRAKFNKASAGDTASLLYQTNWSGRAEAGLAGDDRYRVKVSSDGALWREALSIDPANGLVSLPLTAGLANGLASLDSGGRLPAAQLPANIAAIAATQGLRNRLRNPSFAINQRNVSGVVTLVARAFGHDGLRAGGAGATYTFASSGVDTLVTVTAGSLVMPIEANAIEGGAYVLAHEGTAQARVWQGTATAGTGAYATASRAGGGLVVSGLAAATQTNVEFSTGTILRPQLEPGAVATAFERRSFQAELALCQRYFFRLIIAPGYTFIDTVAAIANQNCFLQAVLPVTMRATPTFVIGGTYTIGNGGAPGLTGSAMLMSYYVPAAAAGRVYVYTQASGGYFDASAEI